MYKIEIDRKVLKELRKIPKNDQQEIIHKIYTLNENPKPHGCEMLQGKFSGYYKIRFGNYRIIYEIIDSKLIVIIVKVGNRGHIYK